MLLSLCMILFITESTAAASSRFGDIQIKGTGRVNEDRASMDIHIELINSSNTHPSPSQPILSASHLSFKVKDHIAVNTPASFTRKRAFGVETAQEFTKAALDTHNTFRAIHNVPPLKLNLKMTKEANDFAKKLAQNGAKQIPMAHEDQLVLQNEDEGENIAAGGSIAGGMTAYGAVNNWYKEACSYNWAKGGYQPQAAHFMQVIWKSTTELGIGKAEGMKHGRPYTYIVARYKPAITYDALKNVFKGKFNPSFCRHILTSSQSDLIQNKTNFRTRSKAKGSFSKQPRYYPKKLVNIRPLSGSTQLQTQSEMVQDRTKSQPRQSSAERFSKQSRYYPSKPANVRPLPGNNRQQAQSGLFQNKTNSRPQSNPDGRFLKQPIYYPKKLANVRPLGGSTRLTQTQSEPVQDKIKSQSQQIPAERFSGQSSYHHNKLQNFRPLKGNTGLQMSSFNVNKPGSYGSLSQPYYGSYKNGYLNNAKSNPYGYSQQNDKLSFYAGNSWRVADSDRPTMSMTSHYRVPSAEYFPKQPEVLEEIVDGDDPDKGVYGGNNNQYQANESFTQRFIPVIKSDDTEYEDDDDDDDNDPVDDVLQRKAHIPKQSK